VQKTFAADVKTTAHVTIASLLVSVLTRPRATTTTTTFTRK